MSMLVRDTGMPPLLLVSDLSYETDLLMSDQVPGTGDPALLRSSFAKVRALKEKLPNLVILAAHDLGSVDALKAATFTAGVR
jgi:ABC-type polysaccharide/polyol phosphate transport system ATPase subunit